ncbi:hypothetical protein ACEPAF_114 [Sanghuangporus sanghuang]
MNVKPLSTPASDATQTPQIDQIREDVLVRIHEDWSVPIISESNFTETGTVDVGWRSLVHLGLVTHPPGSQKLVVVKEFNRETASSVINNPARIGKLQEYYKRECGVWRKIGTHSNIVEVIGVMKSYKNSIFPAIVMPYYSHRDLRTFVSRHSGCPLDTRARMMLDVAQGLWYLHTLSPPIVHRDIKASNIFVKEENRALVACIADFGSAKFAFNSEYDVSSSTRTGMFHWIAPEQLQDQESGKNDSPICASDIWSFGCTFLEILTARDPWGDDFSYQRLLAGQHPERPDDVQIDDMYWSIMENCWERDTVDRPSSEDVVLFLRQIRF